MAENMSKEDMIKEAVEEAKAKAAKDAAEHPQEEAEETAKDMDQSETCTEEAEASEEAEKDDEGDEKESGKSFFGKKKKKDKKDEKIEELTDRLTRQMAEFDNFRKRTDREKSQMYEVGAKDVIDKILPVVDNFERGLGAVTEEEKEDPFVKGMEQIYKQLRGQCFHSFHIAHDLRLQTAGLAACMVWDRQFLKFPHQSRPQTGLRVSDHPAF